MISKIIIPNNKKNLKKPNNLLHLKKIKTSNSNKNYNKISKLTLSFSIKLQLFKFLLKTSTIKTNI